MEINSQQRKKTIVFLGPSMPVQEAKTFLDAIFVAPIKRGDLSKIDLTSVSNICIIDGVFYGSYSVSPFEIIEILQKGINFFGAASMGALKALECEKFGMRGIGKIFNWYKSKKIDAEDEVAVSFNPVSHTTLSTPLVNVRFLLSKALEIKQITSKEKNKIIQIAQNIYFPQRNYQLIFETALKEGIPMQKVKFLKKMSANKKYDLKFQDTLLCLKEINNNFNNL